MNGLRYCTTNKIMSKEEFEAMWAEFQKAFASGEFDEEDDDETV